MILTQGQQVAMKINHHQSHQTDTVSKPNTVVSPSSQTDTEQSKPKHSQAVVMGFESILNDTFLSMYVQLELATSFNAGYDAVLKIGNARIYLLYDKIGFFSDTEHVSKNALHQHSQASVNDLIKRHLNIQQRLPNQCPPNHKDTQQSGQSPKTFFVGLSDLSVTFNEQDYQINHQFGSAYFQEQCVLDYDDAHRVLLVYGLKSFVQIIQMLNTPDDLVAFFEYHRQALVNMTVYPNETVLAQTFIYSPEFYQRAWQVENELISIGMLDKHDTRLVNAMQKGDEHITKQLIEKMMVCSNIWVKLVRQLTQRLYENTMTLDDKAKQMLSLLVQESLYTRMKLMEDVLDYANMPLEDRRQGYVLYQHSYSEFGRPYMLIVYAKDANSLLTRQRINQDNMDLLIDLNSELQDPVMNDLFLLGFDMSQANEEGQVNVTMDVYHQPASKMSELERYLHRQLTELKQAQR